MLLILVHHGDAVGPEVDPMRPLSSVGRAATERLARDAMARGVKPDAIWHSGKLRARQTAEIFWKVCNPLSPFTAERGLLPDDPPQWMRDRLSGFGCACEWAGEDRIERFALEATGQRLGLARAQSG